MEPLISDTKTIPANSGWLLEVKVARKLNPSVSLTERHFQAKLRDFSNDLRKPLTWLLYLHIAHGLAWISMELHSIQNHNPTCQNNELCPPALCHHSLFTAVL